MRDMEQALADQIKRTEEVIKEKRVLMTNIDMAKSVCRSVIRNKGKHTLRERIVATTVLDILRNKAELPELPTE